ncbi:hypothetical protein SNEBB_010771, partial [Seison nebaliae]
SKSNLEMIRLIFISILVQCIHSATISETRCSTSTGTSTTCSRSCAANQEMQYCRCSTRCNGAYISGQYGCVVESTNYYLTNTQLIVYCISSAHDIQSRYRPTVNKVVGTRQTLIATCPIDYELAGCIYLYTNGQSISVAGTHVKFNSRSCRSVIDSCGASRCRLTAQCLKYRTCANCINSASCSAGAAYEAASCTCRTGWSGSLCHLDINECSTANRCNNGDCVNLRGSYVCICKTGWTGHHCDTDINECQVMKPCRNGATCTNLSPTAGLYFCTCNGRFAYKNCTYNYNECASYNGNCKNGATCHDTLGGVWCECSAGWEGTTCETNINECERLKPCQFGGTCSDRSGYYRCTCPTWFTGKNCHLDRDTCEIYPTYCYSLGTCTDLLGTYRCDCKDERVYNYRCHSDINECSETKETACYNGGSCVNIYGRHKCSCPSEYNGDRCQFDTNECTPSSCQNGGSCINLLGNSFCRCSIGYTGEFCEVVINECIDVPCLNLGTCIDLGDHYSCKCREGFTGRYCQIDSSRIAFDKLIWGTIATSLVLLSSFGLFIFFWQTYRREDQEIAISKKYVEDNTEKVRQTDVEDKVLHRRWRAERKGENLDELNAERLRKDALRRQQLDERKKREEELQRIKDEKEREKLREEKKRLKLEEERRRLMEEKERLTRQKREVENEEPTQSGRRPVKTKESDEEKQRKIIEHMKEEKRQRQLEMERRKQMEFASPGVSTTLRRPVRL